MNVPIENDSAALEIWKISSDVAKADVFSSGGSLHNLTFSLPDVEQYAPLAEAPWQSEFLNTVPASTHSRHIELLGGEWACVPFGTTAWDPAHHGFGTGESWTVQSKTDNQICLSIEYPEGHVIERVERKITLPMGKRSVEFVLTIFPRRSALIPIGLHPIFRIPNSANLVPATYECATVDPANGARPNSVLRPNTEMQSLENAAFIDGRVADVLADPQALRNELIQLWNVDGHFEVQDFGEGVRTRLEWDQKALPHCLLWVSNPGMSFGSGDRPFMGIGIEPINSFYDKNDSANSHGRSSGTNEATGVRLVAGEKWSTNYRISCEKIQSNKSRGA